MLTSPLHLADRLHPQSQLASAVRENGEVPAPIRALQRLLAEEFESTHAPAGRPLVIRETARKYQHTVAQLTVWRKR